LTTEAEQSNQLQKQIGLWATPCGQPSVIHMHLFYPSNAHATHFCRETSLVQLFAFSGSCVYLKFSTSSVDYLILIMSSATVYLIRHGEKPEPEGNGLSAQGVERAQALPGVFGPGSPYNIGYIMAEHPGAGEPLSFFFLGLFESRFHASPLRRIKRIRPYLTIHTQMELRQDHLTL
jgi:hypothetical protein